MKITVCDDEKRIRDTITNCIKEINANVEVETRNSDEENKKQDKPINPPVIKSIRVDTHGVDYGKPKTGVPFDYYSYMMQHYYGGGMPTQ